MAGALPATTASICLVTIRQQIDCSIFGQSTRKGRGKGLLFSQGMGTSFFLSSCGMVLLRILTVLSKGGVNALGSWDKCFRDVLHVRGLDISYAIRGDWTLKSNSWCYSRYNQCRTSDRGHARVLERHAEIQTMSELR